MTWPLVQIWGKVKEGTTTVHVDVAVPDNTTLMNNVTIKIKAKAK